MKKVLIIYLIILTITLGAFLFFKGERLVSQLASLSEVFKEEAVKEIIREPAVAGQFYPEDPKELENQINEFLNKAEVSEAKGEILALILPHAGYQFSGQVAAYGFKSLIDQDIDTIILIGNSHQERFEGISVFPEGFYKTPLGEVKIDSKLAQAIINEDERIFFQESAHSKEHSLEVEIPFLQKILDNFEIVPIIFGNSPGEDYMVLAQAISKNIKGKNVLLIASSDFSHYPSYNDAGYADSETVKAILTGQVEELEKAIRDLENQGIPNVVTFACAEDAIKTVMLIAKELGADEIKLLNSANSGDVSIGDKNRVVGYTAIGFYGERRGNLLNREEQEELLEIAKNSVETFVKEGKISEFQIENPVLNQKIGAFVTLKKHGQLRGCIGRYTPTDIFLYQVVSQMAIAAASEDRRFYPVTEEELSELDYEISVLSALEKVNDWQDVEIGKHGVQLRSGLRSGVFLPQVAIDNNWNLETFLGELCSQKLGLSRDCYKQEGLEIHTFTAQVF